MLSANENSYDKIKLDESLNQLRYVKKDDSVMKVRLCQLREGLKITLILFTEFSIKGYTPHPPPSLKIINFSPTFLKKEIHWFKIIYMLCNIFCMIWEIHLGIFYTFWSASWQDVKGGGGGSFSFLHISEHSEHIFFCLFGGKD